MSRWNIVAGIGLVLIAVSALFFVRITTSPSESPALQSAIPETNKHSVSAGMHTLSIANQEPGIRFFISAIETDRAIWAVIFHDGSPEPLGAFFFPPYSGVQSGGGTLWRPLVSGKHYRAVLHEDDGDNSFHLEQDPPLLDGAGLPIQTEFLTR